MGRATGAVGFGECEWSWVAGQGRRSQAKLMQLHCLPAYSHFLRSERKLEPSAEQSTSRWSCYWSEPLLAAQRLRRQPEQANRRLSRHRKVHFDLATVPNHSSTAKPVCLREVAVGQTRCLFLFPLGPHSLSTSLHTPRPSHWRPTLLVSLDSLEQTTGLEARRTSASAGPTSADQACIGVIIAWVTIL